MLEKFQLSPEIKKYTNFQENDQNIWKERRRQFKWTSAEYEFIFFYHIKLGYLFLEEKLY